MRKIYPLLLAVITCLSAQAQAPQIKWQKAANGDIAREVNDEGNILIYGPESRLQDMVPLAGGGYMAIFSCGFTYSSTSFFVKISSSGDTIFCKKISGLWVKRMVSTADGGFVVLGVTSAISMSKYNAEGALLWEEEYKGGPYLDITYAMEGPADVVATPDGGFLILANSNLLKGNDKSEDPVSDNAIDYWLIKTGADGLPEWDKTIGGIGNDYGESIINAPGGGYIISGSSNSPVSGNKTQPQKGGDYPEINYDIWLVKIDEAGTVLWDKTVGTTDVEENNSIMSATADGGFILACITYGGIDGDKTEAAFGSTDTWVLKFDGNGNIQWQKSVGGSHEDYPASIMELPGGGYLLGEISNSPKSGNKTIDEFTPGDRDVWLVKFFATGGIAWQQVLGGTGTEFNTKLVLNADGTVLLASTSNSDISGNRTVGKATAVYQGNEYKAAIDVWMVMLDAETLPVSLLSFTGHLQGSGKALLQWKSATEENFSHFELEKSTDLQFYSKVTKVMAKGNNSSYAYTDNIGSGTTYYRLKMVDKDGKVKYSNIVAITSAGYAAVTIAPNPVSAGAMLTMTLPPAPKNAYVQIVGIDGKMYGNKTVPEGAVQLKLDTKALAKGNYVLVYSHDGKRDVTRFIKN